MIRREIWISLQQTGQCITSMPVSTCIACIGMVSVVSSRVSFCYRVASVVRRRRRLSSSVCRARFVTAEPPDLKLCTCIPLGPNSSQTKIQSDPTFGHCSLTVRARITKFWGQVHLARLHYILYDFPV